MDTVIARNCSRDQVSVVVLDRAQGQELMDVVCYQLVQVRQVIGRVGAMPNEDVNNGCGEHFIDFTLRSVIVPPDDCLAQILAVVQDVVDSDWSVGTPRESGQCVP